MFGQKTKETFPTTSSSKTDDTQIKTLISQGCKFEGDLFSPDYTRIDGNIIGHLRGDSGLIIGEKGVIDGDVSSVEVVVYGRVNGNIKAHKLELKNGGIVTGDITIDELILELGSKFNGQCKMQESTEPSFTEEREETNNIEEESDD